MKSRDLPKFQKCQEFLKLVVKISTFLEIPEIVENLDITEIIQVLKERIMVQGWSLEGPPKAHGFLFEVRKIIKIKLRKTKNIYIDNAQLVPGLQLAVFP